MSGKFEYQDRPVCVCGQPLHRCAQRVRKYFEWGEVQFVHCSQCGSWCQSPQLALRSLREWFDSPEYHGSAQRAGVAYVDYLSDEGPRLPEARSRYARDLKQDLPYGAFVLEVGCATGSLLSVLRDGGLGVMGVDLSPSFARAARRLHELDVVVGDPLEVALPTGHFDAVLLFGTIGNLQNLPQYLRRFMELLKSRGLLVFNFVDAASPVVRYLYRSRFWMFTPSANCLMSSSLCRTVLENSGFQVVSIKQDWQRPSLLKLFNHAQLQFAIGVLKRMQKDSAPLPFPIPIPSVKLVKARAMK